MNLYYLLNNVFQLNTFRKNPYKSVPHIHSSSMFYEKKLTSKNFLYLFTIFPHLAKQPPSCVKIRGEESHASALPCTASSSPCLTVTLSRASSPSRHSPASVDAGSAPARRGLTRLGHQHRRRRQIARWCRRAPARELRHHGPP
jgi:hypothetical protein